MSYIYPENFVINPKPVVELTLQQRAAVKTRMKAFINLQARKVYYIEIYSDAQELILGGYNKHVETAEVKSIIDEIKNEWEGTGEAV